MKKVLYDTPKTKKYLDSLMKIYMIGIWIGCGVREHYFTGKCDKDGMPLVYDYYDGIWRDNHYKLKVIHYKTNYNE